MILNEKIKHKTIKYRTELELNKLKNKSKKL